MVLDETDRNLAKKAPTALRAFAVFRGLLAPCLIEPPAELVFDVTKRVEPKDAAIIAAAVAAGADYLVTYDRKHLLRQQEQIRALFEIAVVTPDALVPKGG